MNQKGILNIHWLALIFAFFLGIGAFAYNYFISEKPSVGDYIGDFQLNLIKNFQKGDNVLLYIDQSAKYSLQQAVYELAQNGGIIGYDVTESISETDNKEANSDAQCRKLFGYSLWYELKKDESGKYVKSSCFDENQVSINLQYLFNKNLNQYLLAHPHNIPIDNYDYEIKGTLEVIGKAIFPLKFDILKDETKQIVKEAVEIKIDTPQGTNQLKDFTGTELCAKGEICFLTKEASEKLEKAQLIAKEKGVSLLITSAHRDKQKQIYLWEVTYKEIPVNKRRAIVCYPYGDDAEKRCPHLTGNAVDVVFKGKTTKTMTREDWELLKKIMTSKDEITAENLWVKYLREPWHYECCSTNRYMLAKEKGVTEIV